MQDEEITTAESLPGTEQNVPASDSEPAVSVESLTLEELESTLGKKFPTKEAALKSIKDTFSFVGKKVQPAPAPAPAVDPNQYVSRTEFEEATFYAKHPEYESQKELISAFAAKHNKPVSEVVQMDSFKTVFEKVKAADAIQQKSVIHTNPRLGQVTDKMTQAKEASKAGNHSEAAAKATAAVLELVESK